MAIGLTLIGEGIGDVTGKLTSLEGETGFDSILTSSKTTEESDINAEISSPASPIIAKITFTGTETPFSTPIWSNVPSKKESNSIVALSVSISANN